MTGDFKIPDDVAYLAGCGLEAHGCVLASNIGRGERLSFDRDSDLAVVLSGAWCPAKGADKAVEISGPSVIVGSDVRAHKAYATQDLRLLGMNFDTCRRLLSHDLAFRALFFHAMTARMRVLSDALSREPEQLM
ncbi:MAG: hypothetical protein AAFP87_12535 [Pseudomonadota bacterium]